MSSITIAIIAYFLISLAALLDKFLLSTKVKPWQYVFYVGLFGIFGLVLLPFGFSLPGLNASLLSLLSGAIFILALAPLYFLVSKNEVTRASPLVGALVPIFTLLLAIVFLGDKLTSIEVISFLFLLLGGFTIIFRRGIFRQVLHNFGLALAAAFLFAASFVAIKAGFNAGAGFIGGYVVARMGGVLISLLGLLIFKKQLLGSFKESRVGVRSQIIWVGTNKIIGAIGFLVLNYAIFLGNVSIIQAIQGVQYVFLLVLGIILGFFVRSLREEYSLKIIVIKVVAILLIFVGLGLASLNQRPSTNPGEVKKFGVTFSTLYADKLELDYKETFSKILFELGVRDFRLVAYWTEIEAERDKYDFSRLDWLVEQVEKNNGNIILTLGRKVPRFPECHIPQWVEELEEEERKKELLSLVENVVLRYRDNPAIKYWQVENEPFLPTTSNLGECPSLDVELLDAEIALVKSLDTRPVVITDSGELSDWLRAYSRADVFGTTMYRVVWAGFGYFHQPISPDFFFTKENIVKLFHGNKKIINIELQAEPWGPEQTYLLDVEERRKSVDLQQMRSNINFAREVGHEEVYLWGVEWWYWEKQLGYPEFWEEAKTLF